MFQKILGCGEKQQQQQFRNKRFKTVWPLKKVKFPRKEEETAKHQLKVLFTIMMVSSYGRREVSFFLNKSK